MNILQVCPDPYGKTGGLAFHIKSISERLAKKHNVTVYATNRGLKYPKHELINSVRVERFNCYAPGEAYYFSLEMLLKLRKAKFDIVHAHGYHAFPFHFAVEAERKELVATPHFHGSGHTALRKSLLELLKPFGKRTLKEADKIIAVSEYEKSLIREEFDCHPEKIEVIPNGVDYNEFLGLKRRDKGYRSILYVGYLVDYKGPQYLVEVLPRLDKDIVLEIVGKGPARPFLEKRAFELGVLDRVKFSQDLTRKELVQKFVDADVFALLSKYEAYSIVVAEALTAGTQCIVTNTSALQEWVDDETCFGVDFPISLNRLGEMVNSVMDNRIEKQSLGKWRGKKVLDWNEVTSRTEAVYEDNLS